MCVAITTTENPAFKGRGFLLTSESPVHFSAGMNVRAPYNRRLHVLFHNYPQFSLFVKGLSGLPSGRTFGLFVNFKFLYLVSVTMVFRAIYSHITGGLGSEGNGIVSSVTRTLFLDLGPGFGISGHLNIVGLSIFAAPFDDHFADRLTGAKINLQPMVATTVFIPVGAGASIDTLGGSVTARLVTGSRRRHIQRQITYRGSATGAKAADVSGLRQLIGGQINPAECLMGPPLGIAAADLGLKITVAAGAEGQTGTPGSGSGSGGQNIRHINIRERRHIVGLAPLGD